MDFKTGIYPDMPEDEYHADPVPEWSLSASGASLLLDPSCPALYLHHRTHPKPRTKALDMGTLAHSLVLGAGRQPVLIPDRHLSKSGSIGTDAARAFIAAEEAKGNIPVKSADWKVINDMADALQRHPVAGRIFQPGTGDPEVSMFWRDERHGIMRRARLDWLPRQVSSRGRIIVADYKTARSAHPSEWRRAGADYGYHRQDANYTAGVKALGIAKDVAMVYVVQEKTAPYLVSVFEITRDAVALGEQQMDRASAIFARCLQTGHWPDYTDGAVLPVDLPTYYATAAEAELEKDIP